MEDKLRQFMDNIFSTVPPSARAVELKEEILQNLLDKYHDLLAEGKTEQAAYNIAVASVGDINELLESVRPQQTNDPVQAQHDQQQKQRSAFLTSIAVALYILCPRPAILFENNEILGPIMLLMMVAIATGIMIYNGMMKSSHKKTDDTIVEGFKEWKAQDNDRKRLKKAISSALWALVILGYILISFATGAWHITWVIFLIGASAEGLIEAILDYIEANQ